MSRMRGRLTYANIMATIAVFIALGGASYAAISLPKNSVGRRQLRRNAVTGGKVKNGSLTGADINVGTLIGVPSAQRAGSAAHADTAHSAVRADSADRAGHAETADSAAHADSADSAGHADTADSAAHADTADSAAHADSADSATTAANFPAPEAMHFVGAPGEPPFVAGWENALPSSQGAAFFMDREGVVHLQGRIHKASGGSLVAFTLPASYAPAETQTFPAFAPSGLVRLVVMADGKVGALDFIESDDIYMNGISWRSGQ